MPLTTNNNMNSKVNKELDTVPEHLGMNGTTPSGKPRLFVCSVCTRAFARHEHLKRHERSHTKEKPFHCGVCQRQFSRRDLLLRHAQKLHAGCDDAVRRLRRRSSRSKSTTIDSEGIPVKKTKLGNPPKVGENINYFLPSNDTNRRRTSFSAASGANYGSFPTRNAATYSESVEFSTPQLLPVDVGFGGSLNINGNSQANNNQNWMSDLNHIPGLDFLNNFSLSDNAPSSNQNKHHEQIDPLSQNSSFQPQIRSNGSDSASNSFISSTPSTSNLTKNNERRRDSSKKEEKTAPDNDIFGYSFYDDDFTFANQMEDFQSIKLSVPKFPSTYLADDIMTTPSSDTRNSGTNSNLPEYNEYELLSELEIPNYEEKILSVGYSFYESNDFASSTVAPSVLAWKNGFRNNNSRITGEPNETDSNMDIDMAESSSTGIKSPTNEELLTKVDVPLSSEVLFTPVMFDRIKLVLKEYPFVGLPAPELPPIGQINEFVESFKRKFLIHYPFIHKTVLNEEMMIEYIKGKLNEETTSSSEFSRFVCLPLLIATIGALYSNEKKIATELYEISRRCIHVYLDSRKKSEDAERSTTHNSPLWLVQSLVLSVFYGLFAEFDETDMGVVLRQVNALCTLIKVSKFNLVKFGHKSIEINKEYFNDYILYQSKIRTVYMIFNISNILTCVYDLIPFIKYKEIKCDLPDLENYWECANVEEFKEKCVDNSSITYNLNLEKILSDILTNNQIHYKLSEFGAFIVMSTVLQYFYFNKNTNSNFSAGISPYHSNSSNLVKNFRWEDLLIDDENKPINLESTILKNIAVIRSLQIDISKVKQMMWNRNWMELSNEFVNLNPKNDDLLDACDYSIRTLSLIFINDETSSNFKNCLSLNCQFLFFSFFYIAKFLHKFEKKISKLNSSNVPINKNSTDYKQIPKNFSIYLKIAKFLADLEQIFIKNFNYHDVESKLALKGFDRSRYNFGNAPKLLEAEYPREVNLDQVIQVVRLRLSLNILKIGEFVFNMIYEKEMSFNIFKSLSDGLFHLRVHLEAE